MGSRKERKEPRPALVCPLAPLPAEVLAAAPAVSSIDDELNREACALIDSLIAQGAEVGVHCVAYHHGRLVLDVLAGVCARQAAPLDADGKLLFEPVTPETRFMCYSVAKGVAATVLARALDSDSSGYADPYEMPVAAVWPEFAHGGKGAVTIGDALSHRAGLHPAWPVPPPVLAALLGRLLGTSAGGADGRTGHACVQLAGEGWIAGCTPAWAYDRARPRAAYHATSWSWLVTGLCAHLEHSPERRATPCPPAVQGGCARQHVRDGCRELARALRVPLCQLQIGEADPGGAAAGGSRSLLGAADGPVSLLLRPRSHALLGAGARECAAFARLRLLRAAELGAVVLCGASGDGSAAGRLAEGCLLCVLWPLALWLCAARWVLLGCLSLACTAETFCFVSLGNSAPFLRLCLPSSNLMATAGALGKLYGALANGGSLEGAQALSPEVVANASAAAAGEGKRYGLHNKLCAHADDESRDAPAPGLLCRLLPKGRRYYYYIHNKI
ncbi:hypothetical protein T492DRAFT_1152197 [Pavlovales sp. CCMP2436]|nr:hypothetical protein T492DRAFT_1152197 [Pavlovales sp. CCMP2436]